MGRRGPIPKPDWLKVLDGNPGKRPAGRGLPSKTVTTIPTPEHFNEEQQRIWKNVCDVLKSVNALAIQDQFTLIRYVELLTVYRKAADWMQRQADGNIVYPVRDKKGDVKSIRTLPQLKAMLEISNHLLRIEQHFGLTPSSRTMILRAGDNGAAPQFDIDPFA